MNAQQCCREGSFGYMHEHRAPSRPRPGHVAARRAVRTVLGKLAAPALRLHRYRDLHARMLEGALRGNQGDE